MLPEDHPSSFCHLLGLTSVECSLILKSFGALKMRGQMHEQHFRKMPSNCTCMLQIHTGIGNGRIHEVAAIGLWTASFVLHADYSITASIGASIGG
jgi:hypothetical protein